MDHQGFFSLIPPLVAILLAIFTRRVFISLLLGIWLGWLALSNFDLIDGSMATVHAIVDVFKDAGNTRTVIFGMLVGALIIFIQRSGGVQGFILLITRYLEKQEQKKAGSNKIMVQFLAWLTGLLIFVESGISVLTVGALYRPMFDKLKISREKLAYLADSSSAPSSILIPFNGWGAFIMTLLVAQGFDHPFSVMFSAMKYNFYPMLALILALVVVFFDFNIGPMKKAEERVRQTGELHGKNAKPMISDELTSVTIKEGVQPKAFNMVLPILVMVLLMPIMLAYTGWESTLEKMPDATWSSQVFYAIGNGSGSTSVLVAVLLSILFSMVLYKSQKIMGFREMIDYTIKGMAEMLPLALLMVMAFAIGSLCKKMGTGVFIASSINDLIHPGFLPFLIFLVSCITAFAVGSSWGTFALMIPLAVPMAQTAGGDVYLAIAAAIGGGVFGDHCSPISDTTILSSMAAASDHIDHVRTQLPYALIAGISTAVFYLIIGFL